MIDVPIPADSWHFFLIFETQWRFCDSVPLSVRVCVCVCVRACVCIGVWCGGDDEFFSVWCRFSCVLVGLVYCGAAACGTGYGAAR